VNAGLPKVVLLCVAGVLLCAPHRTVLMAQSPIQWLDAPLFIHSGQGPFFIDDSHRRTSVALSTDDGLTIEDTHILTDDPNRVSPYSILAGFGISRPFRIAAETTVNIDCALEKQLILDSVYRATNAVTNGLECRLEGPVGAILAANRPIEFFNNGVSGPLHIVQVKHSTVAGTGQSQTFTFDERIQATLRAGAFYRVRIIDGNSILHDPQLPRALDPFGYSTKGRIRVTPSQGCTLSGITVESVDPSAPNVEAVPPELSFEEGEQRVFPERASRESPVRRFVRVVAQGTHGQDPPYVKRVDVDDPADDRVIDPILPGKPERIDNHEGYRDSDVVQFEDGSRLFEVSPYPGDNYKFVASCDPTALADVDSALRAPDGVFISKLVTVWRSVWLQVDEMQPVSGNFDVVTVVATLALPDNTTAVLFRPGNGFDWTHYRPDNPAGFEASGHLVVPNGNAYRMHWIDGPRVDSPFRNAVVVVDSVVLLDGQQVALIDDDDVNDDDDDVRGATRDFADNGRIVASDGVVRSEGGTTIGAPPGLFDALELQLRPLYLVPKRLPVEHSPAFQAHLTLRVDKLHDFLLENFVSRGELERRAVRDPDFWDVYALMAYQPDTLHDFDGPDRGLHDLAGPLLGVPAVRGLLDELLGPQVGVVAGVTPVRGGPGFVMFSETNGEYRRRFRGVVYECHEPALNFVHELGHALGLGHFNGGIMAPGGQCQLRSRTFAPASVAAFRKEPFASDTAQEMEP
jgi:hypothetical protein